MTPQQPPGFGLVLSPAGDNAWQMRERAAREFPRRAQTPVRQDGGFLMSVQRCSVRPVNRLDYVDLHGSQRHRAPCRSF